VAGQGTRVYATGEKTTATSIAGPGRGRAALDGGGRLPAVAGHLHGLGTWGTRTWMAEQDAFMFALWLQRLAALFAARVWGQPGVEPWVCLLPAEAEVAARHLAGQVDGPTVGAAPVQTDFLAGILLLLLFQQEYRVLGPFLCAVEVETSVAGFTIPDWIQLLYGFDADEAGGGLQRGPQQLLRGLNQGLVGSAVAPEDVLQQLVCVLLPFRLIGGLLLQQLLILGDVPVEVLLDLFACLREAATLRLAHFFFLLSDNYPNKCVSRRFSDILAN